MRPSGDGRNPAVQTVFLEIFDWLVMTQSSRSPRVGICPEIMLKVVLSLLVLSCSGFANGAWWQNVDGEPWCHHPTAFSTAPVKIGPDKKYCLSDDFKLKVVDSNFLHFVSRANDQPEIFVDFFGEMTFFELFRVSPVPFHLEIVREYSVGELRLLRFESKEPKTNGTSMIRVYIEFPSSSVVTIFGADIESVDKALDHLVKPRNPVGYE